MPTLAETQLRFRDAVVHGDLQHVSSLASQLVGGRSPEKRLIVHQRNYRQSLVDALLTKFPATGWLLGTQTLTEAVTRFIREYPPQAPCIAEFGAGSPDFPRPCARRTSGSLQNSNGTSARSPLPSAASESHWRSCPLFRRNLCWMRCSSCNAG